ncbi:TetR family transcriptional regulator [Glutamicibacter uratoxydans]|uniref:TetR family transcriptional regulator n=1 Tax=Glutamicibacter uratoxydans TaxID=43667 RepID=A0A4Y4DSM1_GLUUR|nr:TetR/AcrR family transcriptional regulator [Glutamicibacter uratoxydans]GED05501.1 TetR family transcriptional regulator [Glutamicibacter uratoxydans]
MRSDALRRRELILRTARQLFAEHGANIAMESIADASNVGIGTLYRNFTARPELVEEVTLDMLRDVKSAAEEAVVRLGEGELNAWDEFLQTLISLNLGALSEALGVQLPATVGGRIMDLQRSTVKVVNQALEMAKQENLIRHDITGNELITGIGIVTRPLPRAFAKAAPGLSQRLTSIMMDGMKPNPALQPAGSASS